MRPVSFQTVVPLAATLLAAIAVAGPAAVSDEPGLRVSEPIVLSGADLAALYGRAVESLAVRAWRGAGWDAVPFQVDEHGPDGVVLRTGDGRLDEGDELVFMADALGDRAPDGAWPPEIVSSMAPLVVSVTDPLRAGWSGTAYLFAADAAVPAATPDPPLVAFDRATAELRCARYTLGLARNAVDEFVGLKRLSLFGGDVNVLDRSKLRARLRVFGFPYDLTEETLEFHTAWDIPEVMRRVGPVRVVLDDMARGVAYEGRIELHAALDGVEIPSEFGLSDVRASLDFRPEAMPATYRDANVPEGVAIDGRADTVPAASTSRWREIGLSSGRLVFLTTAEVPSGARMYYKDDSGRDPRDTGDRMSYGDNGVLIPDPDAAFATGLHLSFVVLGPDEDISPEQLVAQHDHPLVVSVTSGELAPTPSATVHAVTATSTPSVTSTPGDEATPSAVVSGTATSTPPPEATATPSGPGAGHCYLAYVAR